MVQIQKPDIVAVVEPRISGVTTDNFIQRSGFDSSYRVEASGFSGRIWVLWKPSVRLDILVVSSQFVHGWCPDFLGRKIFFITFIYASPNHSKRSALWDQMRALEPAQGTTWTLGGDFNVIASLLKRRGGSRSRLGVCEKFNDFLFDSGLLDMGFHRPHFTWERGDFLQRLDRCLCNEAWYDVHPASEVIHLPKLGSGHRLILLDSGNGIETSSERPYHYLTAWNEHSNFQRLVKETWREDRHIDDNVLYFQCRSTKWNKEVFSHIGRRKTLLLACIKGIEVTRARVDLEFFSDIELDLKHELAKVLENEESLWHQKSRTSWISKGDRNTNFFT
ncbi:hypothetical protein HRI_002685600 [Hibiscus trionum]|uniref:Endonuclease/exonuclease/phosphatase domain-containing protein n=1 Tax=Hibiscus trionum TaxID=183268 RepID=A0A9W7I741_HIBTR|nr:hypothetical protein HRI_002685600 [Hibiscus trionum]